MKLANICKPLARSLAGKAAGALMAGLLLASTGAVADGPFPDMLSTTDRDRLSRYEPVRRATLKYVREHASQADLLVLESVLAGSASDIAPADLAGDWNCRTLKLARKRELPLAIYASFRCRIIDDSAGLHLEKLSGSQRTAGTFYDIGETKLGYVGAQALGNETSPPRYGHSPERNQVGYLIPVSVTHMRLEFPQPPYESDFDILELRRPLPMP